MSVHVKNLKNTTGRTPSDGSSSWKDFWEKAKKKKFSICANTECIHQATLGGHVQKVDDEKSWYIVPLCSKCNSLSTAYFVNADDMVPVRS